MSNVTEIKRCALVLFFLPSILSAANWVRWDANEFPGAYQDGDVFTEVGSGTEQIMDYMENGNPTHTYFCNISAPAYGHYYTTKPAFWSDANSTVEFRLRIQAYCGDTSVCNDPNVTRAFGIKINIADANWIVGFYWAKMPGTDAGRERITSIETSSNFSSLATQDKWMVYRMFYDAGANEADLFYFDESTQEWKYLVTSSGYSSPIDSDCLVAGDWSGNAVAGRYEIDYQRWTNDGLITRPEYCGDMGTVFQNGDLNSDCYVNFADYALFMQQWILCSDPANSACNQ